MKKLLVFTAGILLALSMPSLEASQHNTKKTYNQNHHLLHSQWAKNKQSYPFFKKQVQQITAGKAFSSHATPFAVGEWAPSFCLKNSMLTVLVLSLLITKQVSALVPHQPASFPPCPLGRNGSSDAPVPFGDMLYLPTFSIEYANPSIGDTPPKLQEKTIVKNGGMEKLGVLDLPQLDFRGMRKLERTLIKAVLNKDNQTFTKFFKQYSDSNEAWGLDKNEGYRLCKAIVCNGTVEMIREAFKRRRFNHDDQWKIIYRARTEKWEKWRDILSRDFHHAGKGTWGNAAVHHLIDLPIQEGKSLACCWSKSGIRKHFEPKGWDYSLWSFLSAFLNSLGDKMILGECEE